MKIGCSTCGDKVKIRNYVTDLNGRQRVVFGQEASLPTAPSPTLDANIDPSHAEEILYRLNTEQNPENLEFLAGEIAARYPIAARVLREKATSIRRRGPTGATGTADQGSGSARGEGAPQEASMLPRRNNPLLTPPENWMEGGTWAYIKAPIGLNVRSSPTMNSDKLGLFTYGTPVIVLGTNPNGWLHIKGRDQSPNSGRVIYGWVCNTCSDGPPGPWVITEGLESFPRGFPTWADVADPDLILVDSKE